MNEATMPTTQKVAEVESGVPNTTVNLASFDDTNFRAKCLFIYC